MADQNFPPEVPSVGKKIRITLPTDFYIQSIIEAVVLQREIRKSGEDTWFVIHIFYQDDRGLNNICFTTKRGWTGTIAGKIMDLKVEIID